MVKRFVSLVFLIFVFTFRYSFSAHPLITDDTGTQGKGNWQIELNGEYEYDKNEKKSWTKKIDTVISYGFIDKADLVLTVPYLFLKEKENGILTLDENGISDISLELKYRFYGKEGLSFALKPGISFPTGDDDKCLGAGKATYGILFITTKEFKNGVFHFNLGYTRDESTERENLYHLSVACEVPLNKKLRFVADLSGDSNEGKGDDTPILSGIVGLIYSPGENFDIAFGIKIGLNSDSPDFSILPGITFRF